MTIFRVWAPKAEAVDLEIGDRRVPMTASAQGWWQAQVADAGHGSDYRFSLDGGPGFPDPCSPWQPEGPHGPSRTYDHSLFQWSDRHFRAAPLSSAVIYELHVGTFTPEGTFDAAIAHLNHLVELGVTHIELLPVAEFPGQRGWGYDGVDIYAPHHAYGGPDGLKRLVNACHVKGLAVILDVVYNHFGPDGAYWGAFGPYFTSRYATPWGDAINYDGEHSDEVRRFFLDNALMWLRDYHMDALRLDAVHAIIDTSAVHILEQLAGEVDALEAQLGRPLALIAESDLNDPRFIRPSESGGYGLDAQWSDDFRHSLHTVLTQELNGFHGDFGKVADLAKAIRNAWVYDGRYSPYRKRRHGRPPGELPGSRFLAYLQNHDQIGNRAKGERSSQLLSTEQLQVAAALIFASPFVPMLFQGEEWGASTPFQYFTDHTDPALGKAVSEGRIKEFAAFGWDPAEIPDPQAAETFSASKLKWDELGKEPHASLLEWHKSLIRLRSSTPALASGDLSQVEVQFDEAARWMIIRRGGVVIACNLADSSQHLPYAAHGEEQFLLCSNPEARFTEGGLELPAHSVLIFQSQ